MLEQGAVWVSSTCPGGLAALPYFLWVFLCREDRQITRLKDFHVQKYLCPECMRSGYPTFLHRKKFSSLSTDE